MRTSPDEKLLESIVDRIVQAIQPQQIIRFGSAAKGTMGPDSDIDLLIIKPDVHRGKTTAAIFRQMRGVGHPVDIIVAHPEDLDRYGNSPALVLSEALRGGRVIYES